MDKTLNLVDRFFQIILNSQMRHNDRQNSEWTYLLALLRSQPVSYDRIDAYLNILQQQGQKTRRAHHKGNKIYTQTHPQVSKMLENINAIEMLLNANQSTINEVKRNLCQ